MPFDFLRTVLGMLKKLLVNVFNGYFWSRVWAENTSCLTLYGEAISLSRISSSCSISLHRWQDHNKFKQVFMHMLCKLT